MNDETTFGPIAYDYDRYLGPLLFEPFAEDLSRRFCDLSEGCFLELAAGTGVSTRRLDQALAPAIRIVAIDISSDMLKRAKKQSHSDRICWRVADVMSLPFVDESFDAAACQFEIMFMPDKRRAFEEVRRVLRPRARFVFSVWDRIETCELSCLAATVLSDLLSHSRNQFICRAPYSYWDLPHIESDLLAAGFQLLASETLKLYSQAANACAAATSLCLGSPVRTDLEAHGIELTKAIDIVAESIASKFGQGLLTAPMQAHVITVSR